MEYRIEIARSALDELKAIKAYHRRQITHAIEQQLSHQPTVETRNRKPIVGAAPDFAHVPPIWQLRVGDYRLFYDVEEQARTVCVRAVREKPSHAQTEDIL